MASFPAVSTKFVVFDTAIIDLTEKLTDPVEALFGVQLGGGTDINRALAYVRDFVTRPTQTHLILITDLFDGGNAQEMLQRAEEMVQAGINVIVLLALSDDGKPSFDQNAAQFFASLGCPVFACTPDRHLILNTKIPCCFCFAGDFCLATICRQTFSKPIKYHVR